MCAQYVNSLAVAGYPQGDIAAMKQAEDRVINARKQFGTLCGVDKETGRRGGNIGKTMEEHITGLGLHMNNKEDVNALDKIGVKAHQKGVREFGEVMKAWDNWNKVASKIGQDSEVTNAKIEALASLRTWGAGEAIKEGMKIEKFESYLERILQNSGKTLKQVLAQAGIPSRSPTNRTLPASRTGMTKKNLAQWI